METLRSILRDIALVTYSVAGVFLCLVLWKAGKALDTVNAPKSGTLSMLDDTILQGRLTINAGNKVILHEQAQLTSMDSAIALLESNLNTTVVSLATVAPHVNTTMDALTTTASAASSSLQAITGHVTPVLDSTNTTVQAAGVAIAKLEPVEDDTDRMVKDFDARVTSKDVDRALKGVADTSEQAALTTIQVTAIATDIRKAADAATAPAPWWKKALGYGNLGVNIACLATHSCPF